MASGAGDAAATIWLFLITFGNCGAVRAGFSSLSAARLPVGANPGAVRSGRSFLTTLLFSLRTSKTLL